MIDGEAMRYITCNPSSPFHCTLDVGKTLTEQLSPTDLCVTDLPNIARSVALRQILAEMS
jgi:hypothetical protein